MRPLRLVTTAICLAFGGSWWPCLQAQSGPPSLPNAGRTVTLPFGQVDAVSGDYSATIPLGPRMPGRIVTGFDWLFDQQSLPARAVQGGQLEPVVWPKILDPNTNMLMSVAVGGRVLQFYPQATAQAPQSASYWLPLLAARGVVLQGPTAAQAPSSGKILGSTFHCAAYPSSDGTQFLIPYAYTTQVAITTILGTTTQTFEMNAGFVVIDGAEAIWTQSPGSYSTLPMPKAEMAQTYATTHLSNQWGDDIDITESFASVAADASIPTGIVISDRRSQASISLDINETSTPTIFTGAWLSPATNSNQNFTSDIHCSVTVTVQNSFGDVTFPKVTLQGKLEGHQRFGGTAACPNAPGFTEGPSGAWDWGFQPTSILETASDGTSRLTNLTWSAVSTAPISTVEKNGCQAPTTVSLSSGLVQTLGFEMTFPNLSQSSFDACSGVWSGWLPASSTITGRPADFPQSFTLQAGPIPNFGSIFPSMPGVSHVTLADPSDSNPTKGQAILISRLWPKYQLVGGSSAGDVWSETQGQHITTILRYGTSQPGSNSPFRGTRLTHLSVDDMGSGWAGLPGYLFATSAIVQDDQIVGTGVPSNLDTPAGWQPTGATTVKTTVYDGFSLASWVNPGGALGTALPVTAVARRTTVYTPSASLIPGGLPTKVTLAGDPGNPSASDAYGPVQTDEWTGPVQNVPSWPNIAGSNGSGGTLAASAVNSGNSALSSSVHRRGVIQRHFDGTMTPSATAGSGTMRLLTDHDQKILDGGSTMKALRGVTSVDFGETTYSHDSQGRVWQQVGTRGAFTATETRQFNGNLPQISDVTKTLTQNGTAIYANPDDTTVVVGTHTTFDTTSYQWPKTVTDKVDGRPATILARDGYGRIKAQTDVLGIETDTSYDAWGRVQTVTRQTHTNGPSTVASLMTTTTITADGRHKTEIVTEGDTGRTLTTTTDYDAFGRKAHIFFPDGRSQGFTYDGFGELVSETPALAPGETPYGSETWQYDALGRVTDHFDARGNLLMHVVQQPGWSSITVGGMTVEGVVTTTKDDRGYTRTEVSDLLGQKAAIVDQAGQLSTFSYDQDGHLIGTNQGGQARAYAYNDMGWLTSRTEPEEGTTIYSRFTMLGTALNSSQVGRSGSSSLAAATTLNHHLQPSQVRSTLGSQTITRTMNYDDAGTHLLTGLTETQANGTLTESYPVSTAYDGLYRPVGKVISDGTQTFSIIQSLDATGRVLTLTYPSAAGHSDQVVNGYDSLGRLTTVSLNGEPQPSGSMVYDQVQQSGMAVVDTLTFGNGAWTSRAMVQGKLAAVTHVAGTLVENDPITWTPGGLMLSRGKDAWTYDPLQRLMSATVVNPQDGSSVTQSFTYDPWGNRTSTSTTYPGAAPSLREGLSWSAAYADGRNSLPSAVVSAGGNLPTGVIYDDFGRMTQVFSVPGQASTQMTWVYDAAGRVAMENGTSFLLDSGGLRFRRTHPDGSITYTVYGFHGEPLSVFTESAPVIGTMTLKTSSVRTAMVPVGGGGGGGITPTITITNPASGITVSTGMIVTFAATISPANASASWAFGDGSTARGTTATHAYNAPGTYTVTGSAYMGLNGGTSQTITVTVVPPPAISTFAALPAAIPAGSSGMLSWNTTNATSLAINGTPVSGTSLVVTPPATTTYTLVATNAAGSSVAASLTVVVGPTTPAAIQSFTANPSSGLAADSPVTLSWATTNATSLSIDNGIGTVTGTSVSLYPVVTTTYTLTARSPYGAATQQVTVPVISVPIAAPVIGSFTSSASTIPAGSGCELAWQVSGASSVSLSGVGIVNGDGTAEVTPSGTMTYTLTATNSVGTTTRSLTVNVVTGAVLVWQRTMVYGFGQELREDQASAGTVFMQSDQVGSPNLMTDGNLAMVGRAKTLPFGEALYQSGDNSIRRYTNHEQSEGNAIYMQARMYLQAYGKFAEVDPAYDQTKGDPESWNLYGYVTNNPVTHTDPDGRIPWAISKLRRSDTEDSWIAGIEEEEQLDAAGGGGTTLASDENAATDTQDDPAPADGDQTTDDDGGSGDTSTQAASPQAETDDSVRQVQDSVTITAEYDPKTQTNSIIEQRTTVTQYTSAGESWTVTTEKTSVTVIAPNGSIEGTHFTSNTQSTSTASTPGGSFSSSGSASVDSLSRQARGAISQASAFLSQKGPDGASNLGKKAFADGIDQRQAALNNSRNGLWYALGVGAATSRLVGPWGWGIGAALSWAPTARPSEIVPGLDASKQRTNLIFWQDFQQ